MPASQGSSTSHQLLLETINPMDMTPDELFDLADRINGHEADLSAVVGYEDQHGSGTTWNEVLHVWLPNADLIKTVAWTIVLTEIVDFLKKRFKRKGGANRPKRIIVHDPDGNVIEELLITEVDSEPIPQEVKQDRKRRRPAPRHRKER
jgi:hypothetical protein